MRSCEKKGLDSHPKNVEALISEPPYRLFFHTRKKAVNSKKVYFLSQQTNLGDKRRRK
jgi:hypothetical protein